MAYAAAYAADAAGNVGAGVFDGLRWIMILIMMVVIRFLSSRCCTLIDIKLAHVVVADDPDSPIGAVFRFFIPKHKADRLGTNGGAAMRAYPNLFNQYLCPSLAVSLWVLLCRPYIEHAYNEECAKLRTATTAIPESIIQLRALNNLYLFPRVSSSGSLDFTKHIEHAAASSLLKTIKDGAGFAARAFTWHGIVSVA